MNVLIKYVTELRVAILKVGTQKLSKRTMTFAKPRIIIDRKVLLLCKFFLIDFIHPILLGDIPSILFNRFVTLDLP